MNLASDGYTRYLLQLYDAAYYFNLDDLHWQTLKSSDSHEYAFPEHENYIDAITEYVKKEVFIGDQGRVIDLFNPDSIKKQISAMPSMNTSYRLSGNGGNKFVRCEFIRGEDENHVAIGLKNITSFVQEQKEREIKLMNALAEAKKEQFRTDIIYEISHSGEWSIYLDKDDVIIRTDVSDEANKIIRNYVKSDGYAWLDIVHPDDREAAAKAFYATIKDHSCNTPYDVNYRMIDRKGVYRWYHSAGRIRRNDDGTGEFLGIQVDIDTQMREQQKRLLGAVPLSPDILNKSNIGLWAFELDEGQEPRMYVDEAMLKLLGLTEQISPEATYHAWYDYIDEDSYGLVANAVDKMTAGEHSEVQYPWHHPDGHTMIVRCGGVRNPEYTKGVRIEGTHQDVSETVHYDIKDKKATDGVISAFSREYEAVLLVNLIDDTYKVITDVHNIVDISDDNMYFSNLLKYFVDNYVHPEDKEKFDSALFNVKLDEYISDGKPISLEYRSNTDGEYIWHRCVFNKISKDAVLAGFVNCDDEILVRNVNITLMGEYDTILLANIDKNVIRPVRTSNVIQGITFQGKRVYKEHMLLFSEIVSAQYKQDWINFADTDYMRDYMAKENHREYVYELPVVSKSMRRMTIDVIERVDGVATSLLLSFVGIDDYRAQAIQNQRKLEEQGAFTKFFLEPYMSAYYVGFDDMSCQIYKRTSQLEKDYPTVESYFDSLNEYIDREVHPDDRGEFRELIEPHKLKELLSEKSVFFYLYRTISGSEERRMRFQIIRGADDNHAALGFRDVTEEWKHEQEQHAITDGLAREYHTIWFLEGSGEHNIHLYRSIGEDIYQCEAQLGDGVIGYEECIAKYIREHVFGEDKKRVIKETRLETIERATPEIGTYVVTYRRCTAMRKDYDYHQMSFARAVAADGTVNYILAFRDADKMIRDRVAQKEKMNQVLELANQQRYIKAFGDRVNVAVWSLNVNEINEITEIYWSNEMRHMYGFEETEEDFPNTIGAWVDILHPSDKERIQNYLSESLRRRNPDDFIFDIEYRIKRKSGEYCWYHADAQMEVDDDGMRKIYGIIYDVSADKKIKEQEAQIEMAFDMAQAASHAKAAFLDRMTQDIYMPLNAIKEYTKQAENKTDSQKQINDYLQKIGDASDYMSSSVNDAINMSRSEADRMIINEKEEDLSEIIHALNNIVQADARKKNIDFVINVVDVGDEFIYCDKLRLSQALLNVFCNMFKATYEGGKVALSITERDMEVSKYATYEFAIRDNKARMVLDDISIAKDIVDMMGGTIDINCNSEEYTEVIICLDFKLQDTNKIPVPIPALQNGRALVIDSNTDICLPMCDLLVDIGMRSEWCAVADEAIARAEAAVEKGDVFKLFVIDWVKPEIDCIKLAGDIRRIAGDEAAIIVITSYDWSDIEEEAIAAGVTLFVDKPLFPSDLNNVLSILHE